MIDLLYSTGMRVGELVKLNISDINFQERECVVYGKGDKQKRYILMLRQKSILKTILMIETIIMKHCL